MPGGGVIVVVGWPGQWASSFTRDAAKGLQITAGQELTHLSLKPGEEIRSPLVALLFWKGSDVVRAQNVWRRWMTAHNMPRPGGKPIPPALMMCTSDFYPGMKSTAAGEIEYAKTYVNAGVKLDYWWIDAGWYPCGDGWWNIGTWQPDPQRYPNGIKPVADYVHSKGMKLVVWFEPERVTANTWLTNNHPEWLFSGTKGGSDHNLLNLGNPGRLELAGQSRRSDADRARDRPVSAGFQHGSAELLAKQRFARPARHYREPARARLFGLLGRIAAASSRHVD